MMTEEMVANLEHTKNFDFTNQGYVPQSRVGNGTTFLCM